MCIRDRDKDAMSFGGEEAVSLTANASAAVPAPAREETSAEDAKKLAQQAYDRCTQLGSSIRDGCSRLLALVDPSSLQAGITREVIQLARQLEPHTAAMEPYVFMLPADFDNSMIPSIKTVVQAAEPDYKKVQVKEQELLMVVAQVVD